MLREKGLPWCRMKPDPDISERPTYSTYKVQSHILSFTGPTGPFCFVLLSPPLQQTCC